MARVSRSREIPLDFGQNRPGLDMMRHNRLKRADAQIRSQAASSDESVLASLIDGVSARGRTTMWDRWYRSNCASPCTRVPKYWHYAACVYRHKRRQGEALRGRAQHRILGEPGEFVQRP